MPRSDEFVAAAREFRGSRFVVLVRSALDTVVVAARHSRIVAGADRIARDVQAVSPAVRLRLIALTIVVAIAAHLLLGLFVPPHVAPLWLRPHG
ncbi:MAG: hypothetical protein DMF91_00115 [Acidobacteria bacterium]|nr:MAG: hypothetical protein DMF91_00115 [Acidobacteriota bacterium]